MKNTFNRNVVKKLTMVTVNGVTRFVHLPLDEKGHAVLPVKEMDRLFGTKPGHCLVIF